MSIINFCLCIMTKDALPYNLKVSTYKMLIGLKINKAIFLIPFYQFKKTIYTKKKSPKMQPMHLELHATNCHL
jgi:hypothetical protein